MALVFPLITFLFFELVTVFMMKSHYIISLLFIQAAVNFEVLKFKACAAVIKPHSEEEDFYDFNEPGSCQQLFGLFMCEGDENRSDQLLDDYFNFGERVYVLNNVLRKNKLHRGKKNSNFYLDRTGRRNF